MRSPLRVTREPAWLRHVPVGGGGGVLTVIAAVPLLPSDVAVMVAEPVATPLTSPLELTVATEELLLPQVMVRPVSVLPPASFGVAVSCSVWLTNTVADGGLTLTVATGTVTAVTVTADVPLLPSEVAVMVAEPAATPRTSPPVLTVATEGVPLVHVIVRPVSALPPASFGVAVNWTVWPAGTEAEGGLTVTDATGTVTALTVNAAVPLCPSLVALIVADPAARPVASPPSFTLATDVLELAQAITRPPSAVPVESSGTATNWTLPPTGALADAGSTTTAAIGTAVAVTTAVAVSAMPLVGSLATTWKRPACGPAW